jgi:hypothetical protein
MGVKATQRRDSHSITVTFIADHIHLASEDYRLLQVRPSDLVCSCVERVEMRASARL